MLRAFSCRWALVVCAGTVLLGCGDDGEGGGPRVDDSLRLNHIQVLGTHNSYHVRPRPALLEQIFFFSAELATAWDYTHLPLDRQLSEQGIRQIELDVFADPEGGLYADRTGLLLIDEDPESGIPALEEPGFKVLHVQDLDFETTCHTLMSCLGEVGDWSDRHPQHVPILILIEAKDDPLPIAGGFKAPIPIGAEELDALDAEIRAAIPAAKLIAPDEVRGERDTLAEAIRLDGWPTLGESRGKLLFALDNPGAKRDTYIDGHPSLRGRVMFVDSSPGEPEAAFAKLNDPLSDFDLIQELVSDGFLVRTRADADTREARSGDATRRDAALASGAHFISTDYPEPDPALGTGYEVEIPGGMPARCNPITAPAECRAAAIENLSGS